MNLKMIISITYDSGHTEEFELGKQHIETIKISFGTPNTAVVENEHREIMIDMKRVVSISIFKSRKLGGENEFKE